MAKDRNFVKINETEYLMESEPYESDEGMKQSGFVNVSNDEFDRLFNLYQEVLEGKIAIKDIIINSLN